MGSSHEHSELIKQLVEAENSHDVDKVAALVAEDYQSETPAHPERNFTGREQVRGNWQTIFKNTFDLKADLIWSAGDENTIWIEWHLTATQTNGTELDIRGVAIMGVEDELFQWGRIYLEPVEEEDDMTWAEFFTSEENADLDS